MCCDSWRRKESDMTEGLIRSDLIYYQSWKKDTKSSEEHVPTILFIHKLEQSRVVN